MDCLSILERLFLLLPSISEFHASDNELYAFLKQVARREVETLLSNNDLEEKRFSPFGSLVFPYHKMGAIDSLDLFDIDELIIFSFYWLSRNKYMKVLDIGANIGLHSIILSKCGYQVRAYEPDPQHFEILKRNLKLNKCLNVEVFNAAVSNAIGRMEFVRVLGNTTGSHLVGSKRNPYGELKRFPVRTESILTFMGWADLIKLDAEGHEKEILLATQHNFWLNTDALVEVENQDNAVSIYKHFNNLGVNLFSQKTNWGLVRDIHDMPGGYREGTLFISCKDRMPWFN